MAENIDDPTLKAVTKWRYHPSILAMASKYKNRANFPFLVVSKEDVFAEIKVLDLSNAIQKSGILFNLNKSLENGKFPNCLKLALYHTSFQKRRTYIKK